MFRFIQAKPVTFAEATMHRVRHVCSHAYCAWREKQPKKSHLQDERWMSANRFDSGQFTLQNRVVGELERAQPDQLWAADSTYVDRQEGFGYLTEVMNACSRRIIGRHFSRAHDVLLVLTALCQAVSLQQLASVIHHSDQAVQYLSKKYRYCCKISLWYGTKQSVWHVGKSYDKAATEVVFATAIACSIHR